MRRLEDRWQEQRNRTLQDAQSEVDQLHHRWRLLHDESRQNASALLQLVDGVVVLSPNETILLINPSAIRLLDLKRRDDLVGRSFTELVRLPELVEVIRNVVSEHHTQEISVDFQHDGGIRPIRVRVDRIDAGTQQNLQLCLRDETEPRRVEEMRREFVANVSHELKTPLAAIKGYAETIDLAIDDDPDTAKHFLRQITVQCLRLERLVFDMMRLAKAQTGRDHLNLASVALSEIIEESVRVYEPVAIAGDLSLQWLMPTEPCKVLADREAVLTIANNLIGNAVRYTSPGGDIRVSLQRDSQYWCLSVADTGEGIAEDDQQRIFERFYRGTRSTESPTSSTGLGLAIVKHLAQALGGSVRVDSKLGYGSTFEVRLPIGLPVADLGPSKNTAPSIDARLHGVEANDAGASEVTLPTITSRDAQSSDLLSTAAGNHSATVETTSMTQAVE
ncbi:MAG: ATP-binding protein [Planctomycetota bacterium]